MPATTDTQIPVNASRSDGVKATVSVLSAALLVVYFVVLGYPRED